MEDTEFNNFLNFLICSTQNSYSTNKDGEGFYFSGDNLTIKSKNKINLLNYPNQIKNSCFILGHERFATSGLSEDYIHPFTNSEFVLIHNGVMSEFCREDHSDTFCFFEDFNREFTIEKGDREKKIIQTLKFLLDKKSGSFSICLYDIKSKKMYYFKNSKSSINVYMSKKQDILYFSTNTRNVDFLELFFNDFEEMSIKDNKIYSVETKKNKIIFNEIGEIENQEQKIIYARTNYYSNSWDDYARYKERYIKPTKSMTKEENINRLRKKFNIEKQKGIKQNCSFCDQPTKNYSKDELCFLCNDCLISNERILEDARKHDQEKEDRDELNKYLSYCN